MYLLFAICFFSFQFGYSQQAFLHGHILDKHTASPISNAQIVLFKDDHYLSKSKSDHAGKFYFSELLKGTYAVWVVKKGFCKQNTFVQRNVTNEDLDRILIKLILKCLETFYFFFVPVPVPWT